MTSLLRLVMLTLLPACLGSLALGAEDAGAPAGSLQYKRADAKFYARGDVLKANPGAVILTPTDLAQNGDIYTYTPTKKAPKFLYLDAPNDWVEPITPPDMPASLNIAPDAMQIREPHGDVQVAMPNAPTTFTPAADGEPLPDGAVIKTGANSTAAILFGGVDSARLMPDSEAAVQQAVASTSRAVEVDLTIGGVFSKVGTQVGVGSQFQVHTRNGTAQAAAGDFATYTTQDRTDVWVSQGMIDLLAPDGRKSGSVAADGTGPLRLIRYPAIASQAQSQQADAESLTAILNFIPVANQKLAALHQKAAAGVALTANEQAYLQRIKQVPALIKLEIIVPPPAELDVLADGTVGFQGATLSLVELGGKLKDYVATAYQPIIDVKAGPGATYAGFEAAIDACKAATGLKYKVVGEIPAKPAPPPPPPAPQDVVVIANSMVKLNGVALKIDDFRAQLKALIAAAPDVPVTVHADPKASFRDLTAVINSCRDTPVKNLTIDLPKLKEITVSAHADGSIGFHGATQKLDEFGDDLEAAIVLFPDLPVVLHSNPSMDFAKFKAVVDLLKAAPVKNLIIVQPAPQPPPPPKLDAFVQADGSIKFQGAVLKLDDFTAKIKAAVSATPDAPVTVSADPKASYTEVAAVVYACKNASAKNFRILPPAKMLTVTVHGDGSILFHGATLDLDAFSKDIKAAIGLWPDLPIVIHSNPKADYAKFQAVVDASKAAGAKEVTLVPPTPQPTVALPPATQVITLPAIPPNPGENPYATYGQTGPLPEIVVHAGSSISFQEATLGLKEFQAKIAQYATANPNAMVLLKADAKAPKARVDAVIAACKKAYLHQLAIEPAPPAPAPAVAAMPALPPTAETPPAPKAAASLEPLPVIAHADGTIKFQGKTMKIDEFTVKIKAAATANPDLAVIIHSNPKMDYGKFEAVVDACKNAPAKEVDVVPPAPQPPQAPALPVTAETPPATNAAPEVPTPPTAETPPAPPTVNTKPVPGEIDLAADGSLTLDGSAVTEDELKGALATLKKSNPKNPLVMMKSPGVTKEQWTHYVDLCHSLGLKLLVKNAKGPAVATTPPAPKVEAPGALRPSAAEGGPAAEPPAPETTSATNAPAPSSPAEEPVPVEIELTPDGQVSFLGEAVTEDELKARLHNVAQSNSKEPVLIVKDEKVTHDQWQHVVDLCHDAKLKVKIKTVKSSDSGALKPRAHLPVALELPPGAGNAGAEKILPIEIGLAAKGRITFEGDSVSVDELKDRLATIAKGNPDQPLVIVRENDVPDDSVDALVTVCQGVSSQLKISVRTAPSFTPPSLPDNSPADNLPTPDLHLHASAANP